MVAPFCYTSTCNCLLFNFWLEKTLIPKLKAEQVLIRGNATFHKLQTTHEPIKKAGCEILFLSPYSPDSNPIETFWANFKKIVAASLSKFSTLAQTIDYSFSSICQ
ncbi:transposase [Neochlamydia sp. S13]|uniref:transposase n=1 Tax=Neochlamydia sp. S13 TaxID=1353976 RepID=UPI00069444A1|nr:transposase [Neochlamydia sp. S13]BBI17119.1 Putative uncharacterized protein [Neochlamydia sp. S13]